MVSIIFKILILTFLALSISSVVQGQGKKEPTTPQPEPDAEPESKAEPESEAEPESKSEPEAEPDSDDETESEDETEPEAEPESSAENGSKDSTEIETTEKENNSEENCNCKVSDVLTSMADLIKDLTKEIYSMKKAMVKTCPGFNETDFDSEEESTTDKPDESELTIDSEVNATTALPPIPTTCETPFAAVASSCYYFLYYPSDWKSWGDANAYCQTLGGTLAAPHRPDDLRAYLKENFSNVFWVGAKKMAKGDDYEWMNGKMVTPEEFKDGQPSKSAAKFCIYIESFSGYKAVNHYCGEKFSFICEQRDSENEGNEPTDE